MAGADCGFALIPQSCLSFLDALSGSDLSFLRISVSPPSPPPPLPPLLCPPSPLPLPLPLPLPPPLLPAAPSAIRAFKPNEAFVCGTELAIGPRHRASARAAWIPPGFLAVCAAHVVGCDHGQIDIACRAVRDFHNVLSHPSTNPNIRRQCCVSRHPSRVPLVSAP